MVRTYIFNQAEILQTKFLGSLITLVLKSQEILFGVFQQNDLNAKESSFFNQADGGPSFLTKQTEAPHF